MFRKKQPDAPKEYVYFVYCAGFIKIGYSKNPRLRHMGLNNGWPLPVILLHVLPGSIADERALHARFAAARTTGEWFHFSPEIRALLTEHLASTVGGLALLARAEAAHREWIDGEATRSLLNRAIPD